MNCDDKGVCHRIAHALGIANPTVCMDGLGRIAVDNFIQGVEEAHMKRKFTLEFDEAPPLVFVQNRLGNDFELYQDGKKVNGIRSLSINAGYDDFTTHEVEYMTGKTKEENE